MVSKQTEAQFTGVLWDSKKVGQKIGVGFRTIERWSTEGVDGFPASITVGKFRRWKALDILEWIEGRKK